MSTLKQENALKEILENPRISMGGAMIKAGYSPSTAVHPQELTESKGYKELLKKYKVDQETTLTYLGSDAASKPKKRIGELNLMARINGLLKEQPQQNQYNFLITRDINAEPGIQSLQTPSESESDNSGTKTL